MYSGNFLAEAEVDAFGTTRLRIGIHPEAFAWRLEPGAAFTTPEAVIAWSGEGLGGLCEAFHGLYRERLARGPWRDRPRPIVLNNWEATYFDFDHERIVGIAAKAKDLGVELFVLDDGWFGRRDKDNSSLGDWTVDRRKLPGGIEALARDVHALGIDFGLWIEPEMVNADSDLFRAHPDWAIGVPGRERTESRQQLVLDFARPEVVDHIADALIAIFSSAPIDYVKWDMNRFITEPWTAAVPADRQGEFFHRYILGVYELYRRLVERFPDILFESCASGGARFDAGLLAWAPQAWTSDDTDAVERLHDPVGHVARVPAVVDGGARVRGAQPPDRAGHAAVHPGGGGDVRGVRLRAGPDDDAGRRAGRGRAPDRLVPGSPRGPPVRPVPAPAQPVRGRRQRDGVDGGRRRRVTRGRRLLPRARAAPPGAQAGPAARARSRGDLPRHDLDGLVRGPRRDRRPRAATS